MISQDLSAYYDALKSFDWGYEYSDDFEVWSRANEKRQELERLSSTSPEHKALWDQFRRHGYAWSTQRKFWPEGTPEMPARPADEQEIGRAA